ncbi:Uncharacterised protein [uncultured archaeon]|nr:Uncharacterised protein [uncultured archaeon]
MQLTFQVWLPCDMPATVKTVGVLFKAEAFDALNVLSMYNEQLVVAAMLSVAVKLNVTDVLVVL